MIDFLLGVPGKLKTVVDHLTTHLSSTRAAKIDQLDAAISTRAAASTAVSNADYTSGRAAKLDNIDALHGAPPKASGLQVNYRQPKHAELGAVTTYGILCAGQQITVASVTTTYKTLLSLTGSGVVNLLFVMGNLDATTGISGVKLTIDGVVVYEYTSYSAGAATYAYGINVIGAVCTDDASPPNLLAIMQGAVPYKTSLLLEVKANTGTITTVKGVYAGKKVT